MSKHTPHFNPKNERVKYRYFRYRRASKGSCEATIDHAAAALASFEAFTGFSDFKTFRPESAELFRRHSLAKISRKTKKPMSKGAVHCTTQHLKQFFTWLAEQPGYRSKISHSMAESFNLSDKDKRVATARRPCPVPTLEQILYVLRHMPSSTLIEQRDRALIAFVLLTGARDGALLSAKIKHVDLFAGSFFQDAREVQTKNSKTFTTWFFPVGEEVLQIVEEWVRVLREDQLLGNEDPLFPATDTPIGPTNQFGPSGLTQRHWAWSQPIRRIFRRAFEAAGLTYFNPHSFRNVLVQLGETRCRSPEEFKAWSQNLGHEKVLTTFTSYGEVPDRRQAELIRSLRVERNDSSAQLQEIAAVLLRAGYQRA